MIKRKLLLAAALFAVLCFCLLKTGAVSFLKEMPEVNTYVTLTGKVDQIENKTTCKYVYLTNTKDKRTGKGYGKVLLAVDEGMYEKLDVKLGETVEAYCRYAGFNIARNAGNYDERNYYHSLGVSGKFQLESSKDFTKTGKHWNYLKQWMYEIKTRIVDTFHLVMTGFEKPAGIFSAVVAGEKSELDAEIKELYQENGIAHVLAISGLHISLIGMSVYSLLRRRHSYFSSCLISSLLMAGFCVMSGGSVSAVRATIMFFIRMVAEYFGKTFDMLSALALSAILIIGENPNILFNGAFQLSFSAILGVGVLNPIITDFYASENRLLNAFTVSLSVSLATLPIISSIYYEIPLYSVFLNLIIVPLMSFVLGSGILCGLVGVASIALGRFIIGAGVYLLSFVEILCTVIDRIPYSILITGKPTLWQILLFYLILAAGLYILKRKSGRKKWQPRTKSDRKIPVKKVIPVLLWALLLFLLPILNIPTSHLRLNFFDVGQGEGYLIQSPDHVNYLIDGGSTTVKNLKEYRLESALKYLGISTIDYSIITHSDTDHISGVTELIKDSGAGHIIIKNLVLPDIEGNEKQEELIQLAKEREIHVIKFHAGDVLSDPSIKLTCLHPEQGGSSEDSNGQSLVFRLEFGDFKALLTGDISMEEEKALSAKDISGMDLLKVAHHGSRTSTSEDFLQNVFKGSERGIALISAGANNSYGHPHKETLSRLANVKAEVFCTAQYGEITVDVDRSGTIQMEKYLLNF